MAAAKMGSLRIAELLLVTGKADIEAKDSDGRTAVDLAREKGHEDLVQLLRAHSGMS
jgi:ankyrin repeat protein